jgi:phage gp36-like protein
MASPLYATISDLRLVLDSTDAGTGTGAQLSDAQLTLALQAAGSRISLYTGSVYTLPAPDAVHDLALDLGAWWATAYYLKQVDMGAAHPVVLRYTEAMNVLKDIRDGKIDIEITPGVPVAAGARIINGIPAIFTGADSNTTIDQGSGTLIPDTPSDMLGTRGPWWEGWASGVESP